MLTAQGCRILCISEIRGKLSSFNELAKKHNASCIIHTGNFGFFDTGSIERISPKIIREIAVFSPLIDPNSLQKDPEEVKKTLSPDALSELGKFLSGELKLDVPVYTVYGAAEDITVIEKFRSGSYSIPNLHIIDEVSTNVITTSTGFKIRLFGLGGSLVLHRLFDNGTGNFSIAGSSGVMWTTILQIGQLLTTARKSFDPKEIRIFVSHSSPSREGLYTQLALALRSDYTISSSLHFLNGASFNAFTVLPDKNHYRDFLSSARTEFFKIWDSVHVKLYEILETEQKQKQLVQTAIDVFESMPKSDTELDEKTLASYKNLWHFNLSDVTIGSLVLNIRQGKVSTESYSEGFDFTYRLNRTEPFDSISAPSIKNSSPNTSTKKETSNSVSSVGTSTTTPSAPSTTPGAKRSAWAKPVGSSYSFPKTSTTKLTNGSSERKEVPGVWVANGQGGEEAVKNFFTERDRNLIKSVMIKEIHANPEKQFALVYFSTVEEASGAMNRIDREAAGKVSLIREYTGPSTRGKGGRGRGR